MSNSSIHILGIGNLGRLVAHALRINFPETPITLLFHRDTLVKEWTKAGQCIEIVRNGVPERVRSFGYETAEQSTSTTIHNLIIATKTHAIVDALNPFKSRLCPSSTLLFLQNGIGTTEEVTDCLFAQPGTRPFYLAGIFNHGVFSQAPFSSVHIGLANAFIGPVAQERQALGSLSMPPNAQELAHKIVQCPELSASLVSRSELFHVQLQKLAVNAVINPLTAVFDCPNGEIFSHPEARLMIDNLISEISAVFLAILANQQSDHSFRERYTPENLKHVVSQVAEKTAGNISSMRQDVRAARKTEIDYINGYIVRQGQALDVPCLTNTRIVGLVKEKRKELYAI